MSDIRPCNNCGEKHHIDDMKCCQYNFDHYCSTCDGILIMIQNNDRERVYVHQNDFLNLKDEMPNENWEKV
jgi:hypothetical protein